MNTPRTPHLHCHRRRIGPLQRHVSQHEPRKKDTDSEANPKFSQYTLENPKAIPPTYIHIHSPFPIPIPPQMKETIHCIPIPSLSLSLPLNIYIFLNQSTEILKKIHHSRIQHSLFLFSHRKTFTHWKQMQWYIDTEIQILFLSSSMNTLHPYSYININIKVYSFSLSQ